MGLQAALDVQEMGKSWKTRAHLNTGYPYNPIRAAHLQVIRPRVRNEDEEKLFLGEHGTERHRASASANLDRYLKR